MTDAAAEGGPPSAAGLRRALRRATDGAALDRTEASVLLHARGPDLATLARAAAAVRDAGLADLGRSGVVTYSRKVFLPVTRLCRDRCHYCTFATVPARLPSPYLEPDAALDLARRGADLGCKEALFTLGDRPEDRWPQARRWLAERGYDSTLDYVRALAIRVLEETGLLPHLNLGVLSWQDLQRLKPVAASMGLMLETAATRLWAEPGGCHHGSPDKEPAVRLRVLDDAGRCAVPFTTGILVGIGETLAERAESLFAIRRVAREYGGIQEVIVQNFRAKADTAMRRVPDVAFEEYVATVAVARLVLGPGMRIQAPPNLSAPADLGALLRAGVDDWGGVSPLTADHVNPERPWPEIERLAEISAAAGFTLRERLAVHPPYLREPWLDHRMSPYVTALADPGTGLARADVSPRGHRWHQAGVAPGRGPGRGEGRVDLASEVDTVGRQADRRGDFDEVFGAWPAVRDRAAAVTAGSTGPAGPAGPAPPARSRPRARLSSAVRAALRHAADDPARISDEDALVLMSAAGAALDAVCSLADDVRRDTVGDVVTYVVNRNINFTNICYVGCRFCAFAQRRGDADAFTLSLHEVGARAAAAQRAGATEVCLQGGISPDLPASAYVDLARAVKAAAPGIHVHAFSPMEVVTGAARAGVPIAEWLLAVRAAGVDSLPGTAAEILDDDVRWVLTRGKLPAATWVEVVTTAHRLGIPTTATMMYGHVDHPRHWVAHLRLLARVQAETGGFTEFVPLPFVHHNAPLYLAGLARPGPSRRDNRAVHAMARLLLHGRIDHIQCSWVKMGAEGCREMLRGGCDDLGGTLMEETISRMAGSQHGSRKSAADLAAIAHGVGRPARQRTTTYGAVDGRALPAEPRAVSGCAGGGYHDPA